LTHRTSTIKVDTAVKVTDVILIVDPRVGGANSSPFFIIWPTVAIVDAQS
jgi:hypothetical protein